MNATAAPLVYQNTQFLDVHTADWDWFEPEHTAERCRSRAYLLLKRVIDLPLALIALIIVSPLMLVIAIAIRVTSPGAAIFRQTRLGRNGRTFSCFKFRSMRGDAEDVLRRNPAIWEKYVVNGYKLPEDEDPRVTRLGRLLRRTSIDELPQLINVIRGEMSLVGPRPIVPTELNEYGDRGDDLVAALPGITGRWQVSGRSRIQYPERARVELEYVYSWSLLEDMRILVLTIPAVLNRTGAH
jgi:lipopolysaccharide/colanic/teichoic acid biosynthesis glycosyltransferase